MGVSGVAHLVRLFTDLFSRSLEISRLKAAFSFSEVLNQIIFSSLNLEDTNIYNTFAKSCKNMHMHNKYPTMGEFCAKH